MYKNIASKLKFIYYLYYDGFKEMRVGKTLWLLILIKLFVMFVIVKWLFFPNILQENFQTDEARSLYILQTLTKD
ncbi:DUF4492 domain-containing protein [Sulfurimonas sp. SAG-AH-194-L11]|nr:DUF4492 domain-containing protein [Sulfurimonas sp. SAG-AH-194-L11]MDF1876839.1 DUF4492 domain-containing protein [Sulfurimonas sp. SAG-AH-194-L11]